VIRTGTVEFLSCSQSGKEFSICLLMVLERIIFVTRQQINQNHLCVKQYLSIVPGQYKGEALSGYTEQQVMKRAGQIVSPLDQLVNQQNNNSDHHQKGYVYDDIYLLYTRLKNSTTMNRILKIIFVYIAGAASIFGLLIAGYYQFIYEDKIIIEVKTIDAVELTSLPKIDGLRATFEFNDTTVTNLWKIRFYISNKGNKTIIGQGDRKDLLSDGLPLYLRDSISILSIMTNDKNFPVEIRNQKNYLTLNFKQWKAGEYLEVIGYIENFKKAEPIIFIDDRDIIESQIVFTKYEPVEKELKAKLIDNLPKGVQNFIKWLIILTIIVLDILSIFTIRKELKKDEMQNSRAVAIMAFILWMIVTVLFTTPLLWILEL